MNTPTRTGSIILSGIYADLQAENAALKRMFDVCDTSVHQLNEANRKLHQTLHAVIHQLRVCQWKYQTACDTLDVMSSVTKRQGVRLARRIVELEAVSLTLQDQYDLNLAKHIDDVADIRDRLKAEGKLKTQPIRVRPATMVLGGKWSK